MGALMKPKPPVLPVFFLWMAGIAFAKAYEIDLRPKVLQVVSGPIGERTPIYSKGTIWGVQFEIGEPAVQFKFRDKGLDAKLVWSAIQTARTSRITYESKDDGYPVVWELEADGQPVLTRTAIETARRRAFQFNAVLCSIFTALASVAMGWWMVSRARWRRHSAMESI